MAHEHSHLYTEVAIKKLPGSKIELTGSIPVANYTPRRPKAVRNLLAHIELPGFRKGHVTESLFISKYGEFPILEEIAEEVLRESVAHILAHENIHPIGTPNIEIVKLAKDNPIEFKITTYTYPSVSLPDYLAIAKEHNAKQVTITVTDKDVQDTILNIRKSRVPREHDVRAADADKEENLPLYTDAFVQTLGNFKDIADFEQKLRIGITEEKTQVENQKKRVALLEDLVQQTDVETPDILIESELEKMFAQFESDIIQLGSTMDGYLTHIKKTKEDLARDWRGDAEKRAKLELILHEIAVKEKITPPPETIAHEVTRLQGIHKDVSAERLTTYVATMMTKDMVVKHLESQQI
jgi:FKBP-type peptidyl-prolyl cis-trans isomerase (trigger factor)